MRAIILIALTLAIAGCDFKALDQVEIATLGHTTVAAALDEPPLIIDTPSSSSVEYVAPPPQPCTDGQFRVYFCIDGFRQYI